MDKQKADTKHMVRIHIDREPYESATPTTGEALYELAHIIIGKELFREAQGDHEDVPVLRDEKEIHLKMDEHFYSEKEFKIIINGKEKVITQTELSYAEIVALAFENPQTGPNILYTITYRKGPHKNSEGGLLAGQTVKIKNGMIFNVTPTNKS